MFYKKGVLKNSTIITGKHLCWSLFLPVWSPCNFIKKRLQRRCFPVNIANILRTFLQNTSSRLLLEVESENISQRRLNYSLQEYWCKPVLAQGTVRWYAKRFISWTLCFWYFLYFLSRELCGFVLSRWCYETTTKNNLLNEIKINKYSLPSLMGNPDLRATVTDFMAMLQLLITANSKDFLMQLMKFLHNSSQSFLNVKCLLQLLMDMILNFQ